MKPDKKQARAMFHRAQMLAAAEKLFAQKGAAGTTMEEIARAADYSKATLYVYFKNKEEMVHALVLQGMRLLLDRIREAVQAGGGWEGRYYAVCRAVTGFYFENPSAFEAAAGKINVRLEDPGTPQVFHEIFETGEEINHVLAAFLEQGTRLGLLEADDQAALTVFAFWGCLAGLARMAEQKEEYLGKYLGVSREAFLSHAFGKLFRSIRREGGGE